MAHFANSRGGLPSSQSSYTVDTALNLGNEGLGFESLFHFSGFGHQLRCLDFIKLQHYNLWNPTKQRTISSRLRKIMNNFPKLYTQVIFCQNEINSRRFRSAPCHLWGHRQHQGLARASQAKSRESSKTPQWPPKHYKPWKQLCELSPGISQGFTAHCHSPMLPFPCPRLPTCDKSQPQTQLFRPRTVTASLHVRGTGMSQLSKQECCL